MILHSLGLFAEQDRGALGDVQVRGAVEAVAPHLVLLVPFVGQRVDIGMLRHGLVESGVEDGHMGNGRHEGLGRLDPFNVGRIVQRRQVLDLFDGIQDILVDHHRTGEFFAAMHHAVADGRNFVNTFENTMVRVGNGFDQQVDGSLMIGAILLMVIGFATGHFVHDERIADDDTFHHPLGYNLFFIPVKKLVFYRRTAAV